MEKIRFFIYQAFGMVVCNPEWWFCQYIPVTTGFLNF